MPEFSLAECREAKTRDNIDRVEAICRVLYPGTEGIGIKAQLDLVSDVKGAVLAYCATGTRCTVVWALSQSGRRGADEILKITKQAGYNLEGLRPHLL